MTSTYAIIITVHVFIFVENCSPVILRGYTCLGDFLCVANSVRSH